MRTRTNFLFVLLICLSASACPKNESPSQITKPLNSVPVLEVTQNAAGMWNVPGKSLFFRLYDNGIAEFEYPDDNKIIAGKINEAAKVNVLKQTPISAGELQKFISLLNSEDFSAVKDDYKRKCCCTDATVSYEIAFKYNGKQKNTALNNYCGTDEFKQSSTNNIGDFSKILSELMTLADNTGLKYTPK